MSVAFTRATLITIYRATAVTILFGNILNALKLHSVVIRLRRPWRCDAGVRRRRLQTRHTDTFCGGRQTRCDQQREAEHCGSAERSARHMVETSDHPALLPPDLANTMVRADIVTTRVALWQHPDVATSSPGSRDWSQVREFEGRMPSSVKGVRRANGSHPLAVSASPLYTPATGHVLWKPGPLETWRWRVVRHLYDRAMTMCHRGNRRLHNCRHQCHLTGSRQNTSALTAYTIRKAK